MSRERSNGKSDYLSDNGIKHILRSGIKNVATEKHSLVQQAHKSEEMNKCKTDVINIKTPSKSTKSPLVKGTRPLRSEKPSTTSKCSASIFKTHGSPSEKHVSYRRSPRRKTSQVTDFSCEKDYNHETYTVTKISTSSVDPKVISKGKVLVKSSSRGSKSNQSCYQVSHKTQTKVCTNIKQEAVSAVQRRKKCSSESSSRIRRRSSSPVKPCSNVVKRASPSPDKHHSPRSSRRNTFPPVPLRISPRRKSPVKYSYGSIRSPKRKRKAYNIRKASVSPDKSTAGRTHNKDIGRYLGNQSPVLYGIRSQGSPECSVIKTRASSSPIKARLPSVKQENSSSKLKTKWDSGKNSQMIHSVTLKTEFKCNLKSEKHNTQKSSCRESDSALSSMSPQKIERSATERELRKIRDYWSPKQTETNTARILRNGRSLDASPSPNTKGVRIKQEPVSESENHGQQNYVGSPPLTSKGGQWTSSVRREIQFGDIGRNTARRKYESTTEEEDEDEDSLSIPRRKKLRSEVKNDELWEGLQIQRFKRLTPKKEKVETQTHLNTNVQQVGPCGTSVKGDIYSETVTIKPTNNIMQCPEAVTDFDFTKVIVKKERFDYEDEEDSYGVDDESDDQTLKTVNDHHTLPNAKAEKCHNFKSEHTSGYSDMSTNVNDLSTKDEMSNRPAKSNQHPENNGQPIERVENPTDNVISSRTYINEPSKFDDSDNEDMYGLDSKDFQFQTDTSKESQQCNSSSYSCVLDLECDTSISQTVDSEKELEDTFMYYDLPSPSELEQAQPSIEFHQDDDSPHSFAGEQTTEKALQKEQSADFKTKTNKIQENQKKTLVVRDEDNDSTDTGTGCDTELGSDEELTTEVQNDVESGLVSHTSLVVHADVVKEEPTDDNILHGKLHTLTDARAENEESSGKASLKDQIDAITDSDTSTNKELSVHNAEGDATKRTSTSEMGVRWAEESSLIGEETGDKKGGELLKDASPVKSVMQRDRTLVGCGVPEDIPSTVAAMTTPIKCRRPLTEGTTPKRSVRLQERRENTPSKWNEEYVFTPLRRVDESQTVGREQRTSTSTQSDVKTTDPSQTKDILNAQREKDNMTEQGEIVCPSCSDDSVSAPNKKDEMFLDSSPKMQDTGIEISPCNTQRTIISTSSEQTTTGESHLVSSDGRPPLKIRVKKSLDGTTRIVASPSSKSAILNMCPDNTELVLTPCDKKVKKKIIPMRSLLKPNLVLKKCFSPSPTTKRKRSRAPEVSPVEPDDKTSDQSNKKKKEEAPKCNGRDSSRRQQSHVSTKVEKIPPERAGKRKLDDADDLLKNVKVGKHASILWLSENRRHFLLKHDESSPSEIDNMLSDAWKNLGEKERLKYYQRASAATRDENKHSDAKSRQRQLSGKKDRFLPDKDGKMSKKMLSFLSLSPMEQHEELRRWLRFFVYEVSPAEYAKLMADFKETVKDLKENQQKMKSISDLDIQTFYRKILFQKILDIQDKIVDIYHQKREKQDEIVKEGFDILTKRLIVGDDISFSNTVRSDDLQQVLLDLKLLENEKKVVVSGTPLKSKSYENVLEQLQECEHSAAVETPSTGSCSSRKSSPLPELPVADSRFANELLLSVKHQMLPQFEIFNLERDLENVHAWVSNGEIEENNAKEIFEKLSKFFEQESLLNHDINFWAPSLSSRRPVSAPSSVLTDCLLTDQFKMLARNPSVFGSGVKMLIDPSQLKPFMKGRNGQEFRPAPRIVQYPSTLLRYAHNTGDKNQNGHIRRRVSTSKYDKYKTQSLTGHLPVTVHYTGRPRYPISHSLPRMSQLSQIPAQPSPRTRWSAPSPQPSVTQMPRIMVKEPDSRYTSIIHRRIQNVEGGTVVRYTATSMGRQTSS
ncbi:uncharacterized protein LOC110443816 [Mizuhopecten yessoensis]|uniref:HMG box domain-containing protein n=1 Tax=Mizuhopecten yessoensis TaxID=6573 RepID=A0A210PE41_MIZYE|nr:uncharacterized protein LOC110443816 [Mizuhopecten yessoensis]OWF34744.1 hypothetical protein KP79_PYT14141 [Mizuhopecten yessoensis]